jgi:hypothetical protein
MFSGVLFCHPGKVFDERFLSLRNRRVVLNVHFANVFFDRFGWLTLVEHQIVKGGNGRLVVSDVVHLRKPPRKFYRMNRKGQTLGVAQRTLCETIGSETPPENLTFHAVPAINRYEQFVAPGTV